VSGFSTAAGLKRGRFNRERNFEKANNEYSIFKTNPAAGKKTAGLIEKETLILCYSRVGHDSTELAEVHADQYRRARWPALRSQTFEVSYKRRRWPKKRPV
jgi:hypothetical protein